MMNTKHLNSYHPNFYQFHDFVVQGFSPGCGSVRSKTLLYRIVPPFDRIQTVMTSVNDRKYNKNSILKHSEQDSENITTNNDNDVSTASSSTTSATTASTSISVTSQRLSSEQQDLPPNEEDNDFSTWIVSNLKQWPLLNTESSESPQLSTTSPSTAVYGNTTNSSSSTSSYNNVWNDVGSLLLQSTILPFGNLSSSYPDTQATSTVASYLRSPLSQVFNFESILPLLNPPVTTKDQESENAVSQANGASNDSMKITKKEVATATPNDSILKQATARIEAIVTEASTVVSSDTVMALINKASELVRSSSSSSSSSFSPPTSSSSSPATNAVPTGIGDRDTNNKLESLSPSTVRDSVTTYATSILRIADGLLRKGYVDGDIVAQRLLKGGESILKDIPIITDSQALFNEYRSVKEINTASYELIKSTEMGALAGAIYEDTIPRTHALRQTIVARGTSADVTWMISDSIANHTSFTTTKMDAALRQPPFLVRTITIRGFDASDESVDREQLLNQICTATPV